MLRNLLVLTGFDAVSDRRSMDEKYSKRRLQQRAEVRLRRAICLFGVSLVILLYTWNALSSTDFSSHRQSRRPDEGNAYHNNHRRRRDDMQMQDRTAKQQRNHREAGFVDKVLGRNPDLQEYQGQLEEMDQQIIHNIDQGIRWINTELLPPLSEEEKRPLAEWDSRRNRRHSKIPKEFMAVKRLAHGSEMDWESEAAGVNLDKGPLVDFTKHTYQYPEKLYELPTLGEYPKLTPMKDIMKKWPQDDIDHPPEPFQEDLLHFDYTNPADLRAAKLFRDAKLPFKLVNVPEVIAAGEKWTDDYVATHFDGGSGGARGMPRASGTCQESSDNFFAFFTQGMWSVEDMGLAPTRNNDWTFAKWAEHAKYADVTGLSPHKPHFYWQAGVDKEERHRDEKYWTFISRDLPSFSSPTETFFVFEPESQKGIQCRFGERGVTAATHFDGGRNMVAMMTGAKRYILSPPKECSKLGIITVKGNPIFRHSMLNFGHLNEMSNVDMPSGEHEWLERSGDAMAIDTILKAGEVLYIPSHWFHYITSIQKSAQCNVRSGIDVEGDTFFGGQAEVTEQCNPF